MKFKHEYWGDDWQEYNEKKFGSAYDGREMAEKIAAYIFRDEPPRKIERFLEVIHTDVNGRVNTYKVTAEYDVIFTSYRTIKDCSAMESEWEK